MDVLVENGLITRIDSNIKVNPTKTIDGTGKTLLPGLIDCHTHLVSVPGSLLRNDSEETIDHQQKLQLKAYVAAGITSVLDAAAPPEVYSKWEEEPIKPTIFGLSPFITPSEGYFGSPKLRTKFYRNLPPAIGSDLSQIAKILSEPTPANSIGVKVTVEDGYGPISVWPTFNEKALENIRASSTSNNRKIFVHAMSEDEFELGLKLNPFAFVHGGFTAKAPTTQILKKIKDSGSYVISTLAIYDMTLLMWQSERLEEDWLKTLVPELQRLSALDQNVNHEVIQTVSTVNSPRWVPDFFTKMTASWFFNESSTSSLLAASMKAIKMMYDSGIPIVMGSDMGNWPLWTTFFHSYGSTREMELLEQAGLPREEVIVAATSRAAKLIGRSDSLGSIEVGKKADMILLNSNPLKSGMQAFRSISQVIKDGEAKTPTEWLN
jgi:hypothetical protein